MSPTLPAGQDNSETPCGVAACEDGPAPGEDATGASAGEDATGASAGEDATGASAGDVAPGGAGAVEGKMLEPVPEVRTGGASVE